MNQFTVQHPIPAKRIAEILCTAIEQGSGYWCQWERNEKPTAWEFVSEEDVSDSLPGENGYSDQDYPLNPGGAIIFTLNEDDRKELRLDAESIQKGLNIMAEKAPYHLGQFLAGEDDSITADVFLQCCLLGDIVYG